MTEHRSTRNVNIFISFLLVSFLIVFAGIVDLIIMSGILNENLIIHNWRFFYPSTKSSTLPSNLEYVLNKAGVSKESISTLKRTDGKVVRPGSVRSSDKYSFSPQNAIRVYATDAPNMRIFYNVSFGLSSNNCTSRRGPTKQTRLLSYTANRRGQKDSLRSADNAVKPLLLLVLAVGGHGVHLNRLMSVWDSWVDFYISRAARSTSLLLLLDHRDYQESIRNGTASSADDYIHRVLVGNMGAVPVACVDIQPLRQLISSPRLSDFSSQNPILRSNKCKGAKSARNNQLELDQGYRVYVVPSNSSVPFIIFAGIYKFPPPEWAKGQDEEALYRTFFPRFVKSGDYAYTKMTNWYTYHMLNIRLLDFFDYGGKLDNDVSFLRPFPISNLPVMMARQEAKLLCQPYHENEDVSQGLSDVLAAYLKQESHRCSDTERQQNHRSSAVIPGSSFLPGGWDATILWERNLTTTCYSNFIVFWLGLYTAPETRTLAQFWNDWHPYGIWDYRWTDQQWWPRPLAMLGTNDLTRDLYVNSAIDVRMGTYLAHKRNPRFDILKNIAYFNLSGSTRASRDLAISTFLHPIKQSWSTKRRGLRKRQFR